MAALKNPSPRIVAFCCHWCAYAAADLAGSKRLQYPPGVHILRVMCSGMVHPELVMAAFARGADGVMILGCRDGSCHYVDGNRKTAIRARMIVDMLEDYGIDPLRFSCEWLDSTEAERFAGLVTAMHETVSRLDPCSAQKKGIQV